MARLARELHSPRVLDVLAAEDISVRATIGSSYRAVSSAARVALSTAAATIPGDIAAAELGALAGDGDAVSQLVAVGLLLPVQETGVTDEGYAVHPLIRAFAREHPQDSVARLDAAKRRPAGFTEAS